MNRKKWNNCKFEWCCLGILIALELIMSSTFLGYIHVSPISVATAYIPVVVIGCLFGTAQSAFAGLIFGFGSMYKASALYVMADDRLFSPFQSGAPLESLILSVGTRLLFGVLTLNQCRRIQADSEPGTRGWFLFLDVDRFKQVNDTFGHPTGDKVLRRFAQVLEDSVADCGIVGRVGGDEFAVLISRELERAELEKMLSRFLRDITEISPDISVGSSIGAYHFLFPHDITELLTETDAALYEAKESGRGCFVIHEDAEAVT